MRPFTPADIDARVRTWQQEAAVTQADQFVELMKSFVPQLQ